MIDWRRAAYRYPGTPVIPWITRGFGAAVTPIISTITLAGSFIVGTLLAGIFAPIKELSGQFSDKQDLSGQFGYGTDLAGSFDDKDELEGSL